MAVVEMPQRGVDELSLRERSAEARFGVDVQVLPRTDIVPVGVRSRGGRADPHL